MKEMLLEDKKPSLIAMEFSNKVGEIKARMSLLNMLILGVLAGAYIGFGGLLSTSVTFDFITFGLGLKKFLFGSVFSLGLILVVVAGAELFTGNNLIILSFMSNKISLRELLKNWFVIYFANFLGALLIAFIFYFSGLWKTGDNSLGIFSIKIACAKLNLSITECLARSIGCNWLVCLAVWMALGSRTVLGKAVIVFFPIMAFVAIGFEHCIANMYFISSAIFLKQWTDISLVGFDFGLLNWYDFFVKNLVPVTIGNIIGGTFFVGMAYWIAYVRK